MLAGREQPKKGQGMTLDDGGAWQVSKSDNGGAESQGSAKSPGSYICTSHDEELECKAQRETRQGDRERPTG